MWGGGGQGDGSPGARENRGREGYGKRESRVREVGGSDPPAPPPPSPQYSHYLLFAIHDYSLFAIRVLQTNFAGVRHAPADFKKKTPI